MKASNIKIYDNRERGEKVPQVNTENNRNRCKFPYQTIFNRHLI